MQGNSFNHGYEQNTYQLYSYGADQNYQNNANNFSLADIMNVSSSGNQQHGTSFAYTNAPYDHSSQYRQWN